MNLRNYLIVLTYLSAVLVSIWRPWFGVLVCGMVVMWLIHLHDQTQSKLKEFDEKHTAALNEAGKAITDALAIVLNNLKKTSLTTMKNKNDIATHTRELHQLELMVQKLTSHRNVVPVTKTTTDARPRNLKDKEKDNEKRNQND